MTEKTDKIQCSYCLNWYPEGTRPQCKWGAEKCPRQAERFGKPNAEWNEILRGYKNGRETD